MNRIIQLIKNIYSLKNINSIVDKMNSFLEFTYLSKTENQFEFMIKFDNVNQAKVFATLLKLKVMF